MNKSQPGCKPSGFAPTIFWILASVLWLGHAVAADSAQEPVNAELTQQVRQMAAQAAQSAGANQALRIEIEVGQLDPRLHLAPCAKVEPYLPAGLHMWGKTRVGLRCLQGSSRWNVSLPVVVHAYGRAVVVAQALAAGTVLTQDLLALAEVDLAADGANAFARTENLLGRTLARPLHAGEALRTNALRQRQWFAAGETVQVLAQGAGYAVQGEALALNPGLEGAQVRVRFDNGRVVTARATGERRVELDY